jgi:hypothetical protein
MAQGKLQWSSVGVGHACCCCRVALTALPPHGCAVAVPCERGADAASVKRSETGMSVTLLGVERDEGGSVSRPRPVGTRPTPVAPKPCASVPDLRC